MSEGFLQFFDQLPLDVRILEMLVEAVPALIFIRRNDSQPVDKMRKGKGFVSCRSAST